MSQELKMAMSQSVVGGTLTSAQQTQLEQALQAQAQLIELQGKLKAIDWNSILSLLSTIGLAVPQLAPFIAIINVIKGLFSTTNGTLPAPSM